VRRRPVSKRQTFRNEWKGLAGNWRRRDMTKPWAGIFGLRCQEGCTPSSECWRIKRSKTWQSSSACKCEELSPQALYQRERVRKPTRPHSRGILRIPVTRQLPRNHLAFPARETLLGRTRLRWNRLAVVVGGVTTTQGAWESHAQGEGPKT